MDEEDAVALNCVKCGILFHKSVKYPYIACAICDPRIPHVMDEEDFEQRAEQLLKEMETDERFYATVECIKTKFDINVEELLPSLNCDHCLKDFRQEPRQISYKGETYQFCSTICMVSFNPMHFIPRDQRSFDKGTKRL